MHLPASFIEKVHRIFGDSGRAWLPQLPKIVAQCREKWGLSECLMCTTMSLNYIEFATTASGESVAIKVGVPNAELYTEMEALRLYNGKGAIRLIDEDRELGAILIKRAKPGTMLWELGDNLEETRMAATIISQLPVPEPSTHHLPTFEKWVERAFRLTRTTLDPQARMPRDLLDRAEVVYHTIERETTERVVLHGDLHHDNIVFDAEAGWVAIDPKGVIGPPCVEMGRYMMNGLPDGLSIDQHMDMIRERVQIFGAELGYPQETVAACGFVDCILGHCWSFEDDTLSEDWHYGVELSQRLGHMYDL
jgi:streptomycin 6-kinase